MMCSLYSRLYTSLYTCSQLRHVGGAERGMSRNAGDGHGDSWNEGNICSISE